MEIEAGRVLSGRYRLIRPLGHGSQASVWVAEHLALTTQVAVKLIDPDLAKREDARERFRREATAAATLRSAHVVQILDHGIDIDQPFIVMELLDGEDLFERLDRRGRITLRETSRIITQVARALIRAHAAGIIHRDLKPENIFLVTNEDEEVVKVFDFGVAKVIDPTKAVLQRTSIGQLIGTPHYMSPEQVKGTGEVDHRADLWSLSVITYQCVTGYLPYDSEGVGDLLIKITMGETPVPSRVLPGLPPTFDAWFAKACNRDMALRFESARELAEALARAVRGAPDAPGVASVPRPRASIPAPSSNSPAAFEQSGRQTPLPSGSLKRAELASPPPFSPPSAPATKPSEKRPAASSIKSAPAELLSADDFEEVMHLKEEPSGKAPPGSGRAANSERSIRPPPLPTPPSRPSSLPPSPPSVSRERTSAAPPAAAVPPVPSAFSNVPVTQAFPALSPSALPVAPAIGPSIPIEPERPQPVPQPKAIPPIPTSIPVVSGPPSSVPAFGRSELLTIDAPPEFDGSRRKRLVKLLTFAFVIAAVALTWVVVSSQMPPSTAAPESPAGTLVIEPQPRHVEPQIDAAAVDPIKPSGSATAKPSTKSGKGRPGTSKRKTKADDMTIEIPHAPE